MLAADREALVCDLAETYHVLDMRTLPVPLLATLASGLRENSRIRMKMAGARAPLNSLLLAAVADKLALLVWAQTRDGQAGRNRPRSLLGCLWESEGKKAAGYGSAQEYEEAKARILRR